MKKGRTRITNWKKAAQEVRKISSRGKSIAAVAIVAAAVIGAVAYLGTGTSEVRGVSAAEVKETALGSMENVDTVKMDMTTRTETHGEPHERATHMRGDIDRKRREMKATIWTSGTSENMEHRIYLIENTVYMNLGSVRPGMPWVKSEGQTWRTKSRFGMQKEFLERAEVERLADENVDGEKCRVLKLKPTEAYWDYVENMFKRATMAFGWTPFPIPLVLALENAHGAVENLRGALENMSMKGWYSKRSGLPLKFQMRVDREKLTPGRSPPGSGTVTKEMTMRFHDFNEPVTIEFPEGVEDAVPMPALDNWGKESEVETHENARDWPTITITEPKKGLVTDDNEVTVSGTVTADVAENQNIDLTINGSSVAVESDGSFSTTVPLEKGTNYIMVTAQDRAGGITTKTRTVVRRRTAEARR
ncbi:hypothetical protein AKJ39_02800 [candidate division MSBL1 archaeon SCGC-AAA259J03]|uniref:Bacterial Ig-like domain-containing protein n=1 Tax=candidate division MSBL1 archaeon SCGC-AAA259J03 TaxID=1698269 RepID=A0A656YWD4_9EURY|nr:hypothetical protein AKJ39_02800 [candidate division MSBL1 archaeon SCGC-AAA259J03]